MPYEGEALVPRASFVRRWGYHGDEDLARAQNGAADAHGLRYSLFYGYPGRRLVGYDNARAKGDHRHLGGQELPYKFVSVEPLVADFLADIRRIRGGPMTRSLEIHVDESAEAMARRFIDAWHRAERGETVDERHLSFESWEGLAQVLTGKRLELLRYLHRHAARSIAELARALGRDYKRVHADVEALAAAGLIDRTPVGLRADYGEIRARIAV